MNKNDPFDEGCEAYKSGLGKDENPYSPINDAENHEDWENGYNEESFGE